MRLIDADTLIKDFNLYFGGVSHAVIAKNLIDNAPTVDVDRDIPKEVNIKCNKKVSGWSPSRYYCPICGKQQKMSKYGIWYCERCGQALTKEA